MFWKRLFQNWLEIMVEMVTAILKILYLHCCHLAVAIEGKSEKGKWILIKDISRGAQSTWLQDRWRGKVGFISTVGALYLGPPGDPSHPIPSIPSIPSTYRFECSKPFYGDLKQTKTDPNGSVQVANWSRPSRQRREGLRCITGWEVWRRVSSQSI